MLTSDDVTTPTSNRALVSRKLPGREAARLSTFYAPVLVLGAVYVLAGTSIRAAVGLERWEGSILLITLLKSVLSAILMPGPTLLFVLLAAIVVLCCAQLVAWHRSRRVLRPFHLLDRRNRPDFRKLAAPLGRAFAVLLFMSALSLGLTQWKVSTPYLVPFWADELLMRLDYAVHLGNHPWQLLGVDRSTPAFALLIDYIYHPLWLWVIWFAAPVAVAVWAPPQLRRQYLMTFTLAVVVLGTIGAILFSSAGPIFYEWVVGGPGPYVPLIEHLQTVHEAAPLTAWLGREYLWESYRSGTYHLGSGISAMPSMHIAAATLTTLVAFRWNRLAGFIGIVFTAVILYGSVYLAWHYAIDGYVSIAVLPALWWVSGIVLRRWDGTSDSGADDRPPHVTEQASAGVTR